MKNYFEMLNVSETAQKEVIEASYNVLVRKYSETGDDAKIKDIEEAWLALGDDDKRNKYLEYLKLIRNRENREGAPRETDGSIKLDHEGFSSEPFSGDKKKRSVGKKGMVVALLLAILVIAVIIVCFRYGKMFYRSKDCAVTEGIRDINGNSVIVTSSGETISIPYQRIEQSFLTADGKTIVMLSEDGKIYISDKRFNKTYYYEGDDLQLATISNDGIVFGTSDRGVFFVNFTEYSEKRIADSLYDYKASDNGNSVLFQNYYGDIAVYTLGHGSAVKLAETEYPASLKGVSNDGNLGVFGMYDDYENGVMDYYSFKGDMISYIDTEERGDLGSVMFSEDQKTLCVRSDDFLMCLQSDDVGSGENIFFPNQEGYEPGSYETPSWYEIYGDKRIQLCSGDLTNIIFGAERMVTTFDDSLLQDYGWSQVNGDGSYSYYTGSVDVIRGNLSNGTSETIISDIKDYSMIYPYLFFIDTRNGLYVTAQNKNGDFGDRKYIDNNVASFICPPGGKIMFYTKESADGSSLFSYNVDSGKISELFRVTLPRLTELCDVVYISTDFKKVFYLSDFANVPGSDFSQMGKLNVCDLKSGKSKLISENVLLGSVSSGIRWTSSQIQLGKSGEDVYSDSFNYHVYKSSIDEDSQERVPLFCTDLYHYDGVTGKCVFSNSVYH